MARVGMVEFVLFARSVKKINDSLQDAKERGAKTATVDRGELERIMKTINGFDVQILNPRT